MTKCTAKNSFFQIFKVVMDTFFRVGANLSCYVFPTIFVSVPKDFESD